MDMALAGLEPGNARLKECSFLLFAVLAKIFKNEFTPYLPRVIPPLTSRFSPFPSLEKALNEDANAFATGENPDEGG